ncbi:MAG: hypothetical protein ACE5GN_03135, partial [Waddliaceae bacterium]
NVRVPPFELIESAFSVPIRLADKVQGVFESDPKAFGSILSALLKEHGYGITSNEWKEEAFPVFQVIEGGTTYQLNVLSGEIFKNGKLDIEGAGKYLNTDLYHELFGQELLQGTDYGAYAEFLDSKGFRVRLIPDPQGEEEEGFDFREFAKEVQREIQGKWYVYFPQNKRGDLPIPSVLPNGEKCRVYMEVGQGRGNFLIIDKDTLEPMYRLTKKGIFHFSMGSEQEEKSYALVDKKAHPEFAQFDPNVLVWQETDTDTPGMLLQHPTYYDEKGQLLEFEKPFGSDQWALRGHSDWKISEDQTIKGVENFSRFLVIERDTGEKEVFIPQQTFKKTSENEPDKVGETSLCYRFSLQEGKPVAKSKEGNAFLAYVHLAHACSLENYVEALEYLKKVESFEKYSPGELKILGWIFKGNKLNHDNSPQADAVRLYTAWLVHDNIRRTLSTSEERIDEGAPEFDADPEDWVDYWYNNAEVRGGRAIFDSKEGLGGLIRHYFQRRTKVQERLRITNLVSSEDFYDWDRVDSAGLRSKPLFGVVDREPLKIDYISISPEEILKAFSKRPKKTGIPYVTRPDEKWMREQFGNLYEAARSENPKERRRVENLVRGMENYSPNSKTFQYRVLLLACLISNDDKQEANLLHYAKKIIANLEKIKKGSLKGLSYFDGYISSFYKEYIEQQSHGVPHALFAPFSKGLQPPRRPIEEIVPKVEPRDLSKTEPKQPLIDLHLNHEDTSLQKAHDLYDDFLEEGVAPVKTGGATFEFPEADSPFEEASQQAFLDDYEQGCRNNKEIKQHKLKGESKVEDFVKTTTESLGAQVEQDTKIADNLRKEILETANRLPDEKKTKLLKKASILSGEETPLTIDNCIAMFLQSDPEEFRKSTGLTQLDEIEALYNKIGQFLVLSRRKEHFQDIIKKAEKLGSITDDKGRGRAIQELGDALKISQKIDFSKDDPSFLVFQYYMKLYLKEHQIAGLRDMLPQDPNNLYKFPSVLLQRIMGGGKTLVFGHLMALLKADGYHLSIHVPPTPLYETALYDMRHISQHVCSQKERTLTFDDHPARFTLDYLTRMKNTLENAIVNREYITMTNETIRALRCKYIKTRLQILESSEEEAASLEKSNRALKDILKLIRERGIFTLDEVHQALDPRKELNMPYGPTSRPNLIHAKLTSAVIRLATRTKLLNVDENLHLPK